MIVYAFKYNSCTHESSWATISLHTTLKGAYDAMRKHKMEAYEEHRMLYRRREYRGEKMPRYQDWYIDRVQVQTP